MGPSRALDGSGREKQLKAEEVLGVYQGGDS